MGIEGLTRSNKEKTLISKPRKCSLCVQRSDRMDKTYYRHLTSRDLMRYTNFCMESIHSVNANFDVVQGFVEPRLEELYTRLESLEAQQAPQQAPVGRRRPSLSDSIR